MTLIAHTEHRDVIGSFGYQARENSDGLFVVIMWSVIGLAVAALMIWLGLGWPVAAIPGLG
jgi:hypothetical protein